MRLNVKSFFDSDFAKKEFSYSVPVLSEIGGDVIAKPTTVSVNGHFQSKLGMVTVCWQITSTLCLVCDRCLCEFDFPFSGEFVHQLLRNPKSDQDDEAILLDEDWLDVDRAVSEDIFLNLPTKILCSEDCKGLCSVCGINKNNDICDCEI